MEDEAAERHSDELALDHLRTLITIPTVSRLDESSIDWSHFDEFISTLERLYPRVHSSMSVDVVDGHALLFRWAGRSQGDEAVLMAHYDVVAADDETGWAHPPFAATVTGTGVEQIVWGRGTLDDKGAVTAILEAAERLLDVGFTPEHDVYLSFGHNEETAGSGAAALAAELERRGVHPRLVLDEGGAVIEHVFPGVSRATAVVGVSEKGMANVTLTVERSGGHASTPPRMTATARLARALVRLEKRPFPASLPEPTIEMIQTIGAHSTPLLRFFFTRARIFRVLLLALFSRLSDETNAMIRTTAAVTQLRASDSANALAERAVAVVNTRIAIGTSVDATLRHIRRAVRDPLVVVEASTPSEPSPVSPSTGPAWQLLSDTIAAVYPRAIVSPYVMLGASDARFFTALSAHVYRFTPFEMSSEERATLHATDERMHVRTFVSGIRFYRTLIERL
ncbi:M20/M25/M40 family metallo-hydrolase [Agreia pratensis]|uniref:Carboxypeptidase PM20D1 n=1 Tax=Agreia pratensis TaxID=150121 RepID=A0A1X7K7W6_9MICO|nr:M20/M25/M40 family metallo-hydrolase [Agreia pratensis]MBF4634311.1 M20/M25/M40 family metallo-hydrolase [Agreia pratensis]SMG36501.1 carboxypeptidase PM20D1 [Agreia pratensis]